MKLNKEFLIEGNQKKDINSFIEILLWINIITAAIPAIELFNQISIGENKIAPIISLIFLTVVIIGLVLMIQVKKSGLYIVFASMTLQIAYSLFSEIINENIIIKNIAVLILWSCLLFLKKNGRSAWSAYLELPYVLKNQINSLEENNLNENIEKKSPIWLEYTVFALAGVVVIFILYSIFIY